MGVRSGGLARGIRVVVEMVWKVWTLVGRGEVGMGLLGRELLAIGLLGSPRRERRDVLMSGTRALVGGSQDGVRE